MIFALSQRNCILKEVTFLFNNNSRNFPKIILCLFKMTYNLGQRKVDQLDHKYHKNTNTFPPNPWVQKC